MAARTPIGSQTDLGRSRRLEAGPLRAIGRAASWLAIRSSRSKRMGHVIVGVAAAVAFILAVIGLRQWDVQNPEVSLSLGALLAGALELFRVGGSPPLAIGDTVPLAWDVARLLAPLATAGAVIAVFLAVGEKRLHQIAARHAQRHLLLVGPIARIAGYRSAFTSELAVHATTDGHHLPSRVVRSDVDPSIDGWSSVAGMDAKTIVVASGDDEANVTSCASVWLALADRPDLEVVVEIDDHETALRLATALAVEEPMRHVEIICRSDVIVKRATEAMLASRSGDRTILIAGAGDLLERVADGVAQQLWDGVQMSGAQRRRIALLGNGPHAQAKLADQFSDRSTFDVRQCSTLAEALAWDPGPMAAFVDFEEPTEGLRLALSLNGDRPGSVVCLPSSGAHLPLGLVPLDRETAHGGSTAGIWATVASNLWPALGDDLDRASRLAVVRRIREAVAALVNSERWHIAPSSDGHRGAALLPSATLSAFGLIEDLRELPLALERSGLTVRVIDPSAAPHRDSRLGTSAQTMLDDEMIEQIAERTHARYVEQLDPTEADVPANRSWQDMTEQQRAMNRQQARQNVVRLAELGLKVTRSVSAGHKVVHELDDEVVERLAHEEHDRWSRQKYAQGYRHGPERNDDAIPKTHPDLVSWDDLDEATRDKDRAPIRQSIPVLEAIGLLVIVPVEPSSLGDVHHRKVTP